MPGKMTLTFAGAEANVAAFLSVLKRDAKYMTALPNNIISSTFVKFLKTFYIEYDIQYIYKRKIWFFIS
jgi:sugar/nucleoside kinase (ribokinase family)